MITYVDTSVLIKLLIIENGTAEASAIWDEPDVLACCRLGHVEARAALTAARRQSRISELVSHDAVSGLEMLWSQLSIVEIDEDLMRLAGDMAEEHGLRGYDAMHLAAAHHVGADVFSSSDRRLCSAASASGLHVANPIGTGRASEPDQIAIESDGDSPMVAVKNSGILGVPVPVAATEEASGSYRVRDHTIQELTAAYKDWMSTDGWIFDAEYSHLDPYLSEATRHLGYITNAIYVKPTSPPRTIAVIIGNYDGKPGNKKDLRVFLTETPDDELPLRAVRLDWSD